VQFPLRPKKTIQAIGVLFRADGVDRMNYMRVLKLLYIADREALKEVGRPIVGGPVMAMERGPVLDEVYEFIKGSHRQMPLWDEYLNKEHYALHLLKSADVGQLSKYEIRKLQEVAQRHADHDEWALSRLTHDFPEWRKNAHGTSSRPIPLRDTLEAVGQERDAVEKIIDEACELTRIQRLLGS
jgi:uncharacterized phage-associated protein